MSPLLEAARAAQAAYEAYEEAVSTPGTPEHEAWHKAAMENMAQLRRDIITPGTPEHEAYFEIHGRTLRDFEETFGPFTAEEDADLRALVEEARRPTKARGTVRT